MTYDKHEMHEILRLKLNRRRSVCQLANALHISIDIAI